MAKQIPAPYNKDKISGKRAGRLFRMLQIVSKGPIMRAQLLKRLKVGTRSFYRDVELLRERGVDLVAESDGYSLNGSLEAAVDQIPFPDPELTFGEVEALMKGRTKAHQKLTRLFKDLTS